MNYVMKLSSTRDGQPNRARVVYNDKATKNDIMKQKTKLKNADQQIWISDDLTKRRSDLAFAARQAARHGKINMTSVHDSKIFVKKTATGKPSVIRDKSDLPT
jgi:hypothetical protein